MRPEPMTIAPASTYSFCTALDASERLAAQLKTMAETYEYS
jgi:hypothetical protein